jgi:hypothetical protein
MVIVGVTQDGADDNTLAKNASWTTISELDSNTTICYQTSYRIITPAASTTHTWTGASRDWSKGAICVNPLPDAAIRPKQVNVRQAVMRASTR